MSNQGKAISKKIYIFGLVFAGVLAGVALTYLGTARFSQHTQQSLAINAESPPSADVKNGLEQAKAVQSAFRYVAQKVQASVVEIDVVQKANQAKPDQSDQFPWRFFFGQPDENQQSRPFNERGLGSGIIVRINGNTAYVLTNNHVIAGADQISVTTFDNKEFKATLVGADERKDMAVIKFENNSSTITAAELGDSTQVQVGDWAIAVGNPFGFVSSVAVGIVSAVGRSGGPDGNISDFIQTDASINKGNSGGALANIDGQVIGMNTWIASPTGGSIGLGFAIPINNVKKAIEDFITKGKVEYGWLGVGLNGINSATAEELGVDPNKGALAASIYESSPAQKAGIMPGDMIVSVNGQSILSVDALVRIVGDLPAGKSAQFQIIRNGKTISVTAIIEKRKDSNALSNADYFPGVIVISLKSEELNQGNLPSGVKGVFVAAVSDKSPASVVGIKVEDIITAVNGKKISNTREFYQAINDPASPKLSFTVYRDGKSLDTLSYNKNK